MQSFRQLALEPDVDELEHVASPDWLKKAPTDYKQDIVGRKSFSSRGTMWSGPARFSYRRMISELSSNCTRGIPGDLFCGRLTSTAEVGFARFLYVGMEDGIPIEMMHGNMFADDETFGGAGGIPAWTGEDISRNSYWAVSPPIFPSLNPHPMFLAQVPTFNQAGPVVLLGSHHGSGITMLSPDTGLFNDFQRTFVNARVYEGMPLQLKENANSSQVQPRLKMTNKKRRPSRRSRMTGTKKARTSLANICPDVTFSSGTAVGEKAITWRDHRKNSNGGENACFCLERKLHRHQLYYKPKDDPEKGRGISNALSLQNLAYHDTYALHATSGNLSNHFADIPVDDMISENFYLPEFNRQGYKANQNKGDGSESVLNQVCKRVEIMPKQRHTKASEFSTGNAADMDPKSHPQAQRFLTDLKTPVQPEEEDSEMVDTAVRKTNFEMLPQKFHPTEQLGSEKASMLKFKISTQKCIFSVLQTPMVQADQVSHFTHTNENLFPLGHATNNGCVSSPKPCISLNGGLSSSGELDKETKNGKTLLKGGVGKCASGSLAFISEVTENALLEEADGGWPHKLRNSEGTKRTGMIDLNLPSLEQLLELAMTNFHNCSLSLHPAGDPNVALPNVADEDKTRDQKIEVDVNNRLSGTIDSSMNVYDSVGDKRDCSIKGTDLKNMCVLPLKIKGSQTTQIQEGIDDKGKAVESKGKEETNQGHEELKDFTRGKHHVDQEQGLKDSKKRVREKFYSDECNTQKDEALMALASHPETLRVEVDHSSSPTHYSAEIPSSPRVDVAARILLDMANSQPYEKMTSEEGYQEKSQITKALQNVPLKDNVIIPQRPRETNSILKDDFEETKLSKDGIIRSEEGKDQTNDSFYMKEEQRLQGKSKVAGSLTDLALRNTPEQEGKEILRQGIAKRSKASDVQNPDTSYRSKKPVMNDTPTMETKPSNHNRRNCWPKLLARSVLPKVPIAGESSQNARLATGQNVKSSRRRFSFTKGSGE
eukprot:Gb_35663 [translate_table: standard]